MTGKRAAYNDRLRAALAADPDHHMHASATAYRAGCRCRACTAAQAVRLQDYRRALKG